MVQDSAASSRFFLNFFILPTTPTPFEMSLGLNPSSLAATMGIAFAFFSSGYLDVSVHRVVSFLPMNSEGSFIGCPIRESSDQSLLPAPRSVSPVSAPFIVSECLGLPRMP